MLFANRDIAGARNVNGHTTCQVRTEYLEHPGFGNSAAPVKAHSLGRCRKSQSGFKLESARLQEAGTKIHGDRIIGGAWTKCFDCRFLA